MKKSLFAILIFVQSSSLLAEEINVTVTGMVCSFCAQGIKKNISAVEGVINVEPDLKSKNVLIKTEKEGQLSDDQIKTIIKDAGYDVINIEREK